MEVAQSQGGVGPDVVGMDDVNRMAETDLPVDNVILRINERLEKRPVCPATSISQLRFGGWDALQPVT